MVPIRFRSSRWLVHGDSLTFTVASATLRSYHLRGSVARGLVKPTCEHGPSRQRTSLARQIGENHLRHVLGEVGVASDLPHRGGVNQVDVPRDEFAEGRFGTFFCVGAQ